MQEQNRGMGSNYLKSYTRNNSMIALAVIFGVIFAGFIAMMIYFLAEDSDTEGMGIFMLIMVVCAAFLGYFIYVIVKQNKDYRRLEESDSFPMILSEFASSQPFASDTLRLSQHYVFSKGSLPHSYFDIERIYQYVHTTNGIEDHRQLRVHLTNVKQDSILCKLKTRGKSDREAVLITSIICSKNPNIKVGAK